MICEHASTHWPVQPSMDLVSELHIITRDIDPFHDHASSSTLSLHLLLSASPMLQSVSALHCRPSAALDARPAKAGFDVSVRGTAPSAASPSVGAMGRCPQGYDHDRHQVVVFSCSSRKGIRRQLFQAEAAHSLNHLSSAVPQPRMTLIWGRAYRVLKWLLNKPTSAITESGRCYEAPISCIAGSEG
jgi:hypothetical protein